MNTSAILGILILFGAVAILIIYMYVKREKDYKVAMEKYERDMEAYNKAVELYGLPSTDTAAHTAPNTTSATPVAAVVTNTPAASSGEVVLSGVDDNTAALIIAILCDELGKNPSSLRFQSITAL